MKKLASLAWMLPGACVLLLGWIGINAFDEDLSPDAQRIVEAGEPNSGVIRDDNGFVWMVSLAAPPGTEPIAFAKSNLGAVQRGESPKNASDHLRLPAAAGCLPDERGCFPLSAEEGEAIAGALAMLGDVEARIQKMRASPSFIEVLAPASLHAPLADLRGIVYAQEITFAWVRLAAAAHDWEEAVRLLELDMAFNRTVLANAQTMVAKMVAARTVGRNALLATQFWQSYGASASLYQPRLVALVSDLPSGMLEMRRSLDLELAAFVREMSLHGKESLNRIAGTVETDTGLQGTLERLLYQPKATANLIVARAAAQRPALDGVTEAFDAARPSASSVASSVNAPWYHYITAQNPVGKFLADAATTDYSTYQASLHDLQSLLRLTRARISVPPAATPDDWGRVLAAGDLRDPYTDQPLVFDTKLGQPAITARRSPGWPKAIVEATGGRIVANMPTNLGARP